MAGGRAPFDTAAEKMRPTQGERYNLLGKQVFSPLTLSRRRLSGAVSKGAVLAVRALKPYEKSEVRA